MQYLPIVNLFKDAFNYQIDVLQRSILFLDVLRERGSNMIEHEKNGLPPVLNFKYELLLDARTFKPSSNYALLKILEADNVCCHDCVNPDATPVIIVDPRAGHGPGIGGFKRDSEVGIALRKGHPTYFVSFYPSPQPHQTISDVVSSVRVFINEVKQRHQQKPPIIYGNCQAGWLLMLLAADDRGLVGPLVLNGSPLSYWSSSQQGNPMQMLGALSGGEWEARFLSDMDNGELDGAWLAQNFEKLNPTNALWSKYYTLFDKVETEREHFLHFELWWNGFYRLSVEEFAQTLESLFIGDKLENGTFELGKGHYIDLKNIKNPLLIFASRGDNITPPEQALDWIVKLYPSTSSLKEAGQRIVYLINEHVGHLGIFVSAKVAKREHTAILEHVHELGALQPGLYEMKIKQLGGDPAPEKDQYIVEYVPRNVEDLPKSQAVKSFEEPKKISQRNDLIYQLTLRPWVQAFSNPITAKVLRELHPMRVSRKIFSEKVSPYMSFLPALAKIVLSNRRPVSDRNFFRKQEHELNRVVEEYINTYTEKRDHLIVDIFDVLYEGEKA